MKKLIAICVGLLFAGATEAQVQVNRLRTDLRENPLVIAGKQPAFSWELKGTARGLVQQAYELLVSKDSAALNDKHQAEMWSSGKVNSAQSAYVLYQGQALKSNQKYFWKVRLWTNKGETGWTKVASFGTGLFYYKDWDARWIGFDQFFPGDSKEENRLSARYFRKEFKLTKEVKSARAYIMGLGLYELYIDGEKVGNQVLAPAPTDYTKNIKYNAFDVTTALTSGNHAVGVILGNGRFFTMRQQKPYKNKNFGFPKLMFQLEVLFKDGSTQTIISDDSWKGTADGPILANNEYDGEDYDARKEFKGWAEFGFNDQKWLEVPFVQEPGGTFEAQENQLMKVMQDIQPVSIVKAKNGNYIIDFGQNFSGWVKFNVKGNAGQKISLKFAESLQEDGSLFTANLRDAKSVDNYILKGEGIETWEPRFTYHGFRYVEVSGYPGVPDKKDFTGRFVYDDMANTGTFVSSNALLNQIFRNSWWGIASNYKGMPVDCPQRNERQPWLGDRTVGCYGENYMFDNALLYRKWLDDIRHSQKEDGSISDVAPAFWRYYSDNVTWPATYPLVADMLYQQTGDKQAITAHYPYIKKWFLYMADTYMDADGIITKDSYGDWCFPPASIEEGRGKIADKKYPNALLSTAYYYYLSGMLANFAHLSGQEADGAIFKTLGDKARQAFNKRFYHPEGYYGQDQLTENILASALGLVEPANAAKLNQHIVDIIENRNKGHLSSGIIGMQWLMRCLTQMGRADLAYKIATQTSYPSWGYMLDNGATTIWELWNGNTAHPRMNSQNHVMMLGDLLIWYYENLAGIQSDAPGFQKILMKPERIAGLNEVKASHQSIYGKIRSEWTRSSKNFKWTIEIPANTTAKVYLPAKSAEQIKESGKAIQLINDIKIIGKEGDNMIVELGSGVYAFAIAEK